MRTFNILSVLPLAAVTLLATFVRASNVVTLTTENFDSIIGQGKPALVEFYASWCGHVSHHNTSNRQSTYLLDAVQTARSVCFATYGDTASC